ncbi:MAG: hypothetical protein ACE1Y2_07790 [Stenotrophomonas maltophilia]
MAPPFLYLRPQLIAPGLANVAALKERLGEEGFLDHMRAIQKLSPGRPTFEVQLARDKAREAATEAAAKKRGPSTGGFRTLR